ncbi:MAG TPA: tripartite tricarboxylate transporter substrate binding protein [Hyphomicrobiaceae bacterium]|jgi:tripartite-type tricarboxylate transporter receptor subunit TctC|nr:tripartite tricarboxylate transporter substrate binding protein [Hyphomicrobiaceae bacterium]
MRALVRAIGGVLAATLTLVGATAVSAQTYPEKPITIVVPFTPGASTDAVARLTQDILARELGQPIVIENRPGAGGTLGSTVVANAKPDGYTLLITVNSPLTTNMFVQKTYPFEVRTAFVPISLAAESILVLAVNSKVPVKTVPELVDYVKANPGKVSYGSAGVGSAHQIAGEMLNQRAGIDMAHVPYRGTAPAIQDLIVGSIQVSFGTTPAVLPHAQEGTIRILALAEAKRHPDLPGIPTIAETYPGIVTNTWVGFLAPAGTPHTIIAKLNAAMNLAVKQPDVIEKFKLQGLTAVGSSPEGLQELITTEYAHWEKILPALGIQAK